MRIASAVAAFAACAFSLASAENRELAQFTKEDRAYWMNLVSSAYDISSTPPPTPRPTSPPTPPPPTAPPPTAPPPTPEPPTAPPPTPEPPTAPPPTPEPPTAPPPTPEPPTPSEPCEVEVDLTCSLDDDPDTSCDTLEEVTELQCSGCPPVMLCLTYTAAACPTELPPGMETCDDFGDGPEAMADIMITSGDTKFVDGTYRMGAEVCVGDGQEELPAQLFIFVNAPMGGSEPIPSQMSVLDSTCTEQGLTLLQSYGAFDLVQYENSCQGNNDCFVPVTYEYKVKNSGEVDVTITELERTLNGVTTDLIQDVEPDDLRLSSEECYIAEEPTIAECCADLTYTNEVTLTAVGDDGSICDDVDTLTLEKPTETPPPVAPPPGTPEPTTAPPTDICFVQVEVDCVAVDSQGNCAVIPRDRCDDKVFTMGFRYNGGSCEQESNIQDDALYNCEDHNGGPPEDPGTESYIVITDIRGLGIDYFSGFVPVGGRFVIVNPVEGEILGANVNFTVYSSDELGYDNMLQTTVFHTSCSQNTFLKDRYGSIELLMFNNSLQGFVDCIEEVTLTFDITNIAEFNANLRSLTVISNEAGFVNLTDEVIGEELAPGESLDPITVQMTVDLASVDGLKVFSFFTSLVGASPEGFTCRDTDTFNFTVTNNNPAPFLSIPTLAPTLAPV